MAEDRKVRNPERHALRRQLRAAGWSVGKPTFVAGRPRFPLWPAPHTGPAEGVEPYWVEGADRTEVLRTAVRELCGHPPAAEPPPLSSEQQDDDGA
jgi:hypothetical protein